MTERTFSHERLQLAIVDIDGTLADNSARRRYLTGTLMDYISFFGAAPHDPPYAGAQDHVTQLSAELEIVYLTSRADHYRNSTRTWLMKHRFPIGRLVMRAGHDLRHAAVVKVELLSEIATPAGVAVVIEDDPLVATAIADAGYRVISPPWIA